MKITFCLLLFDFDDIKVWTTLIFHGTALPHGLNIIWRCVGLLVYVCRERGREGESERGREAERERGREVERERGREGDIVTKHC